MMITFIARLISDDLALLFPIALLVIALVLLASFRSLRGVVLPLLVCIISIVWGHWNYVPWWFRNDDGIEQHSRCFDGSWQRLCNSCNQPLDQVKSSIRKKAVTIALSSVTIPVFIAAITTIAGFLVLLFSEMVPLEYFGLLIALSMFASGLGTLTLLPAILILSNKKHISLV